MDLVFTLICAALVVALVVLTEVSEWKIFKKAGEKGWKSLIPFYSIFISHHIVGMKHIWFVLEIAIWTFETIIAAFIEFPEWFELLFFIFTTVFTLVNAVIHTSKMCDCFGKGTAFKLGMFFVPYIFPMILAFGSAEYKKPED